MLKLSETIIRENIRVTTASAGDRRRRRHSHVNWLALIPLALLALFLLRIVL